VCRARGVLGFREGMTPGPICCVYLKLRIFWILEGFGRCYWFELAEERRARREESRLESK
jgi:hypothetical protein